jgi:hypothetical protein
MFSKVSAVQCPRGRRRERRRGRKGRPRAPPGQVHGHGHGPSQDEAVKRANSMNSSRFSYLAWFPPVAVAVAVAVAVPAAVVAAPLLDIVPPPAGRSRSRSPLPPPFFLFIVAFWRPLLFLFLGLVERPNRGRSKSEKVLSPSSLLSCLGFLVPHGSIQRRHKKKGRGHVHVAHVAHVARVALQVKISLTLPTSLAENMKMRRKLWIFCVF